MALARQFPYTATLRFASCFNCCGRHLKQTILPAEAPWLCTLHQSAEATYKQGNLRWSVDNSEERIKTTTT
jgi:hypothetical protein